MGYETPYCIDTAVRTTTVNNMDVTLSEWNDENKLEGKSLIKTTSIKSPLKNPC